MVKKTITAARLAMAAMMGGMLTVDVAVLAAALRVAGTSARARNNGTHIWGRIGSAVCYPIVGGRVLVELPHEELDPRRPVIFIGPHPRTYELPAYAGAISNAAPWHMLMPVIKAELRGTPFGWGADAMGAILIDRGDREQAVAAMRQRLQALAGGPHERAASIYLDGTRGGCRDKVHRARLRLLKRYAGDVELCARIDRICDLRMPPQVAGLHALLAAMTNAQVVFVNVSSSGRVQDLAGLAHRPMGTTYVHLSRLPELEGGQLDHDALQRALLGLWEKDVIPFSREVVAFDPRRWLAANPDRRFALPGFVEELRSVVGV